jgi:hypothetical protein
MPIEYNEKNKYARQLLTGMTGLTDFNTPHLKNEIPEWQKQEVMRRDAMMNEHSVYDEILEPDDDFYRAITKDELLERIYTGIEKKYAIRK